jgi:hypothetical protein
MTKLIVAFLYVASAQRKYHRASVVGYRIRVDFQNSISNNIVRIFYLSGNNCNIGSKSAYF